MQYKILTTRGNVLKLDNLGCVVYWSDNGLSKENATASEKKTWQIKGIVEVKPFNNLGRLLSLNEALEMVEVGKDNFLFKNGKPKYRIVDLDHGTTRIWGNESIRHIELL